ncbi:MAG: chemotaxis protein CheX [Gammaproteobacteria bacterium]|nr:chemotaxis protein CheX [Gammaproteobacteria bacterium]
MKQTYLNAILSTISQVLTKIFHQEVITGEVLAKQNNLAFGEVSSVVTLEGEGGSGSIAVSFPFEVIMKIAEIMLPRNAIKDGKTIQELSGEIGEMFGNLVKSDLDKMGVQLNVSKTAVYAGQPHYLAHAVQKPVTFVSFSADVGIVFVELCFSGLKTSK